MFFSCFLTTFLLTFQLKKSSKQLKGQWIHLEHFLIYFKVRVMIYIEKRFLALKIDNKCDCLLLQAFLKLNK